MTRQEFEDAIQFALRGYSSYAELLRQDYIDQREALARVEAELDTERSRSNSLVQLHNNGTWESAQQQLAEAVGLIRDAVDGFDYWQDHCEAFLARHAQAEQQEAREPVLAGEFQREDRYIVIKRKDLGAVPLEVRESLGVALFQLSKHLPKRECLVIESDWPEYEPTWAAIQARVEGCAAVPDEEDLFFEQAKAELRRARAKFPGDRIMTLALAEEFGELCKAVLDESPEAVRKEAVQVACMAARVVLDGDGSVVDWRRERGLDPLLATVRGAEHE